MVVDQPEWMFGSTSGGVSIAAQRAAGAGEEDDNDEWRIVVGYALPDETGLATTLEIPCMALNGGALDELRQTLHAWLAQPLGALAADTLEYSVDLSAESHDSLRLTFGAQAEVATSVGGLSCLLEVTHSALSVALPFATDPTCLQMLTESIADATSATS